MYSTVSHINMMLASVVDNYLSHSYSIEHGTKEIKNGTDNKIGLRPSVCVSVRLRALSRSQFLIDFSPP